MKRQIGISILLAVFAMLLTLLYVKSVNESKQQEENSTQKNEQLVKKSTNDSIAISQEYISYEFYIMDEDSRLVVFWTKTKEKYMDTGIETDSLSPDMRKKLESGIFFKTEAELYDFLESYSS